uniref:PHD-type domain-containing protein n=1 Tax=Culex tarsalis TaxID=7177 RepID=A0A1Q3FWF7_CULTA
MLMVNANLKEKMLRFQIPNELKDDLVYCQRSLRQFVKVHQLLASKLSNGLTQSQISKLKRYLIELEAEMIEIGNEQRPLVQQLDKLIYAYLRQLSQRELVDVDAETAHGYVSRALSVHYEMSFNTKYTPRNVTERLSEAQLVHKYELSSFDEARPKKEKEESQSSVDSSVSPTVTHPYNQKQQVSLLKPKEERFTGNGSSSSSSQQAREQALKKIAPETIAVPRKLVKTLPKSGEASLPRPIPKLPEVSPVKVEEDQDDDDGEEDELPELPPTVAIKKSRLNLLQALTKARNQNQIAPPEDVPKPRTMTTKVKSDSLPKRATSSGGASSDSSPNSRASTPLSVKASDDSCERDRSPIEEFVEPQPTDIAELAQPNFLRYFGLLTLDESKALATRKTERKRRSCNSTERKDFHYGKIDYYEQQLSHIARRRNKRPILYSPPATRGVKKRKHFELIADRTGAGTTVKAGGSGSGTGSGSGSSSSGSGTARVGTAESSKLVLADLENKMCIVCNKAGSPDSLSACVYCCNIYHLKCHSNSIFNPQLLRQRDNICPVCLAKKQQATLALQTQQRGNKP